MKVKPMLVKSGSVWLTVREEMMTKLAGRAFPRMLGACAVLPLVLVSLQAAAVPHIAECWDAWTSSSASSSCGKDTSVYSFRAVQASVDTNDYNVYVQNGRCRVEVHCLQDDLTDPPVSNDFSGSPDQVKQLGNCSGDLKVGSC